MTIGPPGLMAIALDLQTISEDSQMTIVNWEIRGKVPRITDLREKLGRAVPGGRGVLTLRGLLSGTCWIPADTKFISRAGRE